MDEQELTEFDEWIASLTVADYEALDNGEDLVLEFLRQREW